MELSFEYERIGSRYFCELVYEVYQEIESGLLKEIAGVENGNVDDFRTAIETWAKEGVDRMTTIVSPLARQLRRNHQPILDKIPTEKSLNERLRLAVESSIEARSPSHHAITTLAAHRTPFNKMPPEIVTMILGFLLALPPELVEKHPACHRDLHSMCLVSRRLSVMAYPLLYRTVPLWNETAMYLFVRTLCRKPEYGFWTRYFACHITLTAPSVIRKIHGLFFHSTYLTTTTLGFHRLINCFPPYKLGFVDKIGNIYKFDKDNDFPQVLLWLILNLLAKVETVLLQVPITDKEWRRDKVIKAIENKFQRQSQRQGSHLLLDGMWV